MKNRQSIFYNMKVPEGYKFMVILPNYYGKGDTPKEALDNALKAGGDPNIKHAALYLVDPKATVNGVWCMIERPRRGKKAVEVGTFNII